MKFYCVLLLACLLSAGCALQSGELGEPLPLNVNTKNLPPLAAEFVTTISSDTIVNRARLVRSASAVEWFYLANNTGERWTKTTNDLWFYSKIFHADRQVIEYSPIDLNLLGIHQQWQVFAINPDILRVLTPIKYASDFHGWKSVLYAGEVNGVFYEVLWLPQISLAARVTTILGKQKTTTEVARLYVNENAPFSLNDTKRYRTIEYTDLGDMERDPFVLKIQHEMFDHHGHSHF
ncbi:hypothetical protein B0D95_10415 [Cellvibrio sp. PSBB023]|nr:hypothetical protein B0D95_10415 [Cellvibrio sp. PSBB023]